MFQTRLLQHGSKATQLAMHSCQSIDARRHQLFIDAQSAKALLGVTGGGGPDGGALRGGHGGFDLGILS